MKLNRVTALFLGLVLAFSLAACGQGASSASTASSSASSAAAEGKTEEQLLAEENEILSANDALWEKVFSSMDKNVTEPRSAPTTAIFCSALWKRPKISSRTRSTRP